MCSNHQREQVSAPCHLILSLSHSNPRRSCVLCFKQESIPSVCSPHRSVLSTSFSCTFYTALHHHHHHHHSHKVSSFCCRSRKSPSAAAAVITVPSSLITLFTFFTLHQQQQSTNKDVSTTATAETDSQLCQVPLWRHGRNGSHLLRAAA